MKNTWQLYEKNDYKTMNFMLDSRFKELINASKIQIEAGEDPIFSGRNVRKNMEQLMDSINGYGASDTEPRAILVRSICNKLNLPLEPMVIEQL